MAYLGQTVITPKESKDYGKLYADIPKDYPLDALREDLRIAGNRVRERSTAVRRARSLWVDMAAKALAMRFNDYRPQKHHQLEKHVTHHDGFTALWRRVLWTAVKAKLYGSTMRGWVLVQHMIEIAGEALELNKPAAYAWSQVKLEMVTQASSFI